MPDTTQAGLHAVRPTFTVGGSDHAALTEGLQRLEITETIQGLYRCEAVFGNWGNRNGGVGFLYFDRALLEFGADFQVKAGRDILFDGRIMGLEASFPEGAPPDITVLAEDRFQDLRMTRRTRTFPDATDADVIRQIASDHGLSPDVNVSGPTYKVLAQVNLSDLAFLRERARSVDAELWMEGRTLQARTRPDRRGTAFALSHGHELRSFTVVADLATQRTSVTANGWSVSDKQALQHEAAESLLQSELNGDESGARILSAKLGERKEALAHTVPLNSDETRSAAESHFKSIARRFVVGRGVAETQPRIRAGAVVKLQNLGPLFSGDYYLAEVTHRFDSQNGLSTEFTAERAGLARASGP